MIVLCSKSPRRIEIFNNLGLTFQISPAEINEDSMIGEKPLKYLERISKAKCFAGREIYSRSNITNFKKSLFIASDTIVVLEDEILHKPIDTSDAEKILSKLSGKVHTVHSSVALMQNDSILFDYDTTYIQAKDWSVKEIKEYIQTSKPFDKAGAYGIQDPNSLVSSYQGSYTNVLGFPIRKFYQFINYWL